MIYCRLCHSEVHAGIGFSKHKKKALSEERKGLERMRRSDLLCLQHGQPILAGCDCGTSLCQQCNKSHKEQCTKGFRTRPLKEFKEEYFINVLLKMRQLSYFKEKIIED